MADAKNLLAILEPSSLPRFVRSNNLPPRNLEEMRAKAMSVLASPTTPTSLALELVTELVDEWPSYGDRSERHAKTFLWSLASVLQEFPTMIAEECCDPRVGLAAVDKDEPTVKALKDWCVERVKLYRGVLPRPTIAQRL